MVDRLKELKFLGRVIEHCSKLNDMVIERSDEIRKEIKEFEDSMDYTQQILTDEEIKDSGISTQRSDHERLKSIV
jgi:hypothetical protein|tara:strand:- start:129 stop:353 length:225 start_codon:yes stop_codon:yes gene_type:complete